MTDQNTQPKESSTGTAGSWSRFLAHFKSYEELLARELSSSWNDIRLVLADLLPADLEQSILRAERTGLNEFLNLRTMAAEALLHAPSAQVNRMKPLRRATAALESYERTLDERLRNVPEEMLLSGPEALASVSPLVPEGLSLYMARLRRKRRPVSLRGVLARELHALYRSRTAIEGRYFAALSLATRHVRSRWYAARALIDDRFAGNAAPDYGQALVRMRQRTESIQAQAAATLAARVQWMDLASKRMARSLVAAVTWRRGRLPATGEGHGAPGLQHWSAQSRALDAEAALEISLERCEREILALALRALGGLTQEVDLLMREISSVIDWLQGQAEVQSVGAFPPPKVDIVPASSRVNEFEEGLRTALKALPEICEVPRDISPLPRSGLRFTTLRPRQTLHECYMRTGHDRISAVFERIKNEHRSIVQEIERAREVVRFALETAGSDQASSPILREALQNALSLLKYNRDERTSSEPAADPEIAGCLAGVFLENRLMLSRRILGGFAHIANLGVRRTLAASSAVAAARFERGVRRLTASVNKGIQRFLVYIGWQPAPTAGKLEVVTRVFLPREFTVDLSAKELPALYRHLFRFEPVQDPRFLVGRDREMAAIEEARALWESRRPVALIIVGERGSGKTSLINCAAKRSLTGLELIRGEFSQRMVTTSALRQFLADLVGAGDAGQLEQALAGRKRAIVIEELERTFLRQVGYYNAIRDLQRLIAATCASTLWILAINEMAFQLLNAAVDLGPTFSHRINAGTATSADLRQAILLRHELSGLRLQFPPPPQMRRPAARFRRVLTNPPDPEREFFELLARESGGVFRSAFDMWLGQIEGAQAGILYMKNLESPDLASVMGDLSQEELFTLLAIPQHGGLTAEEHAIIFQKPAAASRGVMDGLLAREIIELDPGRPGFRVRPEAMRIVRETLYRRNLI